MQNVRQSIILLRVWRLRESNLSIQKRRPKKRWDCGVLLLLRAGIANTSGHGQVLGFLLSWSRLLIVLSKC
ncbi:Hypothetical predicted protein [Olea europaea subsp. europaea]|uniref:Uncharacterized protein n=1 Tax=Olea europaea subsp. europaea TaxID=158383 RepID=A0A8S0S5M4_OLEEU|nr:Hypothetical predicted protein [Olea europaea subsp. europaea]